MGRDPVKKNMDIFQKPKTFRDRKKHPSKKQQHEYAKEHARELNNPVHQTYERSKDWKKQVAASMDEETNDDEHD